jgi:hypothetical protein
MLIALGVTTQARALMIAATPIPLRVVGSDVVLVGKVTGFGAKLVPAEMTRGDDRQMQIATIQVSDTIVGKTTKEIKVGYFPPVVAPGGGPGRPIRTYPTINLIVGQESLLFLTRHPTKKDVYVAQMYFDAVTKKDNPNFATELAETKKAARLMQNPMASLKSKDAEERYLTAAMLIARYRTHRLGVKKEKVPVEESKLILTALAEADWTTRSPRWFMMNPQTMFARLGLTNKDGWVPPKDFRKFPEEAKKWLKDNAEKYRFERMVSTEKKVEPDAAPEK